MISVSGKKWNEKKINTNLVEKIQQKYNFSKILSAVRRPDILRIWLIFSTGYFLGTGVETSYLYILGYWPCSILELNTCVRGSHI